MRRPLVFNAFSMNCVSHMIHGPWILPETRQREYMHLDPWIELAKLLERGKFDALFVADVAGLYDTYHGNGATSIEHGMQVPSNDPSLLIPAMVRETEHLGFAFTSSVLTDHPFWFARRVSTLDHLTGGRVAWNIVTSYLNNAAQNFGLDGLLTGDDRYEWAEEYMEVVYKLWEGSWEDDAVVLDLARYRYTDPDKVHDINHVGPRYRVRGPHLCEPSPQRTPVLYQAGASTAGRAFAARHAEGTFVNPPRVGGAAIVRDVRRRAVAAGRRADDVLAAQLVMVVLGSTDEEAQRKSAELDELIDREGMLTHMSGNVGIDLSVIDPDRPIGDVRPEEFVSEAVRSMIDGSGLPKTATFGELALSLGRDLRIVGSPERIADEMEAWADEVDLDGFNLMYVTTPGSFEEFVDHVTPVLQERGLMQREYGPGRTFREKLFPGRAPTLPDRHPARAWRSNFRTRGSGSEQSDRSIAQAK